MTTSLPEDQRLINLSSKAYEHPADRAATAALQSIPALDVVVRKLIEFGYERAYRQNLLSSSVRLGEDQIPQIWADWNAVCARLDLPERYDIYLTQFPITNAAAIGAGKPMVRRQLALDRPAGRARGADGAGPRGGPHPVRPRALHHGAAHPGGALARRPAAVHRRPAAASGRAGAARVVPGGGAVRGPRGDAREPRPARHLPHADGARRRRPLEQAQSRRVHPARRTTTRSGARAGTSSTGCATTSGSRTAARSSA